MKKAAWLVILITVFLFPRASFAASVLTINGLPSEIDQNQEFEAEINLSCPSCSDSYIRGVFYPSGTSYSGYTKDNNGSWINTTGGGCTSYFKISQSDLNSEGVWAGKISFKTDLESSNYKGPGEYFFKVGRYTPSCGSSTTWSTETIISITGPTPTPTPSPTSTPTPTEKPTPTSTATPTPRATPTTKTPTPIPTVKNNPTIKSTPTTEPTLEITQAVLAQEFKTSEENLKEDKGDVVKKENNFNYSKIFILFGIIILIACAILIVLKLKKAENI